MKTFIQSFIIVRGITIVAFLASSYLGMFVASKFESLLDSTLISLHFIWLALVMILVLFLSVYIFHKIYLKFNLIITKEPKDASTIIKELFTLIGLGFLSGLISPFAFQSFFLIIFWLFSKI